MRHKKRANYVFVERIHLCLFAAVLETAKKGNLNDSCFIFLYI